MIGGEFEIEPREVIVTLYPARGGRMVGELPPVRVIDARGTLEGWRLTATLVEEAELAPGVPGARGPLLVPAPPQVVYGERAGLSPGPAGHLEVDAPITLLRAREGRGGGTFEAGAALRLPGPHGAQNHPVDLRLRLDGH